MRKRLKFPYFLTLLACFLLLIVCPLLSSQRIASADKEVRVNYSQKQFITKMGKEVKLLAKYYGIRPSILIAQILLETHDGKTLLASKYHNLFSKKATPGQAAITLKSPKQTNQNVRYAIYKDDASAIRDYLRMLRRGKEVDKRLYRNLATEKGYKAPAKSLQKYLHYTDKTYARRLIQVIESNDLTNYD